MTTVGAKVLSSVGTAASYAWKTAEFGGRALWILGTSLLVLYIPVQHLVEVQNAQEMELLMARQAQEQQAAAAASAAAASAGQSQPALSSSALSALGIGKK
ncbi:mitochondrial translocase of outer membrane Tom22 subunit [Andalucia godoyi]|uniref:Mitochondrial translocase of outer membrane Tom22 subunit n=1 Tax=Andalucia godoyi TaxID=505711 RepID=A0A8K0AJZ4_ANDGO|nr:mitochondrial translocase of outer membrane Tom22 subunit [Andalucia godoyi]|eukprot:ANDGO_08776.mRNA.1 mitochondrial translocase of outer membrane Tom22 subunit